MNGENKDIINAIDNFLIPCTDTNCEADEKCRRKTKKICNILSDYLDNNTDIEMFDLLSEYSCVFRCCDCEKATKISEQIDQLIEKHYNDFYEQVKDK